MGEVKFLLDINCYSENTHDLIGCEVYVQSMQPAHEEIDVGEITLALEESFWECLCDFEKTAQQAFDKGIITRTDQNELFKVFGNFHFSCAMDDKPINIDFGIDPNKYMYSRLVKYLEIDSSNQLIQGD
jgi:hypothetical protein